jgi:hypothetical protein
MVATSPRTWSFTSAAFLLLLAMRHRKRRIVFHRAEGDGRPAPDDAVDSLEGRAQEPVELGDAGRPHLKKEVVIAGDVMAFENRRLPEDDLVEILPVLRVAERDGGSRRAVKPRMTPASVRRWTRSATAGGVRRTAAARSAQLARPSF